MVKMRNLRETILDQNKTQIILDFFVTLERPFLAFVTAKNFLGCLAPCVDL